MRARRLGKLATAAWVALAAAIGAAPARAAEPHASEWNSSEIVDVRLISAVAGAGDLDSLRLGLEFRMQPGWKIYWRSPGQAGYPPSLDWSASDNVDGIDIAWPAPHRFTIFDMETMGYSDAVVLPLDVTPAHPGDALRIDTKVEYLTCKELCVPWSGTLTLDIPAGSAAPTDWAPLIDRYRAQVPGPAAALGVRIDQAAMTPSAEGVALRLAIAADPPFQKPDIFVEGPDTAYFTSPKLTPVAGGRFLASFGGAGAKPDAMVAAPLRITLVEGSRAVEATIPAVLAAAMPDPPAGYGGGASLWVILGLALAGGLVLNLMPCVLPVLSLKFLSVLGHGGRETAEVRVGFLASVAGIVASFMLLAGGLAGLKAAGAAVGWGIQFQQPVFLAAMIAIVLLFACNLFGLFEIQLPRAIADLAGFDSGPRRETRHSLGGHFLTGAFATLLATPCSAPFLGTAVGFALSRGTGDIFLVFGALGIGMSVPYLAIAAFPGLATRLPRPGRWMLTLRRVLGLFLVGTAAWLTWVIASGTGFDTAASIAALGALLVAVLAARRLEGSRLGRHAGAVAGLLAIAMLAAAALAPESAARTGGKTPDDAAWRKFERAEIARLVGEGKTVLVDVTADWCITCQVNKAAVLDRDPVAAILAEGTVIGLRADWTRPDPAIADYLASHGRYGVPFNMVYGPKMPDGVMLSEILTTDEVMAAFAQAGGADILAGR